MKYYFKQGIFPFIYQIFMAMIAFGILMIEELIWLKILLAALNIALYLFIVAAVAYKEGQEALKVQMANDLERREIIRTGEDRPLKLHEEYKPWKGFFFGFIACVPVVTVAYDSLPCDGKLYEVRCDSGNYRIDVFYFLPFKCVFRGDGNGKRFVVYLLRYARSVADTYADYGHSLYYGR